MDIATLVRCLDDPQEATAWLQTWGLHNTRRAHTNLVNLAKTGVTLDLMQVIVRQLARHLPGTSDPDMALNNLERFVAATRNPLSFASLLERDPETLPTLLQILSTSQYLADLLVRDPESFDLLRLTEGQPIAREILVDEIACEVAATPDQRSAMMALRRYKQRETLRIAYGDIVRGQRIDTVTKQISLLADAICEAGLQAAWRQVEAKYGTPQTEHGQRARLVVLGLGKLGGLELNYSSDIDLVLISDGEGKTRGPRSVGNSEFFERVAREFLRLLGEATELGSAYRVDLRLRPQGQQGAAVWSADAALRYYDVSGRTWERQAYVKARPVAGDIALGHEFLAALEPWIFRRYLSRADITGIKALKRRIEQHAQREGGDVRNIKTGRGGIRDIEFVIQFLQLLNGGDLEEIRTGNTLQAITNLERVGCLTMQERSILEENYALLRKIEHRLQIMFDLQTHCLPEDPEELRKLALRTGYTRSDQRSALDAFQADLRHKTELNRRILDHLLHDAFADDAGAAPETELVLDPDPAPEFIHACLSPYRFVDLDAAYSNLMNLAEERIPFLSTRRCRHFLASIAPRLLQAISATPDPDATLVDLSRISDSLGGKGVLWELFSFNPPTLWLYVQLCACSPYLSGILTSHPGMIDELMDSLVLDKLPTLDWLTATLQELCRGAEDTEPILHAFKNSLHLRVGVRDILHKEDVRDTHLALSDIAETCIRQIAHREYERLVEKHGQPMIVGGARDGAACDLVILAMGKLGGREPNYHSDLDVIFLYDGEGQTQHRHRNRRESTTNNQHFFSQLGQRIIKAVTHMGPYGRLYEMDPRLRPTGRSGALAVAVSEFERYFAADGPGQLWERQALCKGRTMFGAADAQRRVQEAVRRAITAIPWTTECVDEIRAMRYRLEETASSRNLKRGPGGTMDVEFTVQMLQLRHAAAYPDVLTPGTLDAIDALHRAGKLTAEDAAYLNESYRFLRRVESGLRLMNTSARHDLPEQGIEVNKLAYLLECGDGRQLLERCRRFTRENRAQFQRFFDTSSASSALT